MRALLLVVAVLFAIPPRSAEAQSPVLRALLAGGGAASSSTPAVSADTTVNTLADMLALTGRVVGDTISVTGNGRTYAVVDTSNIVGAQVVDGQRVLAFDEDTETLNALVTSSALDGYTIGDQVLLGTVRVTGPDRDSVVGPDSLYDQDFAGETKKDPAMFDYVTGTFLNTFRVANVAAEYGATVDVTGTRVQDGVTKRLLWTGFAGYDPVELGAATSIALGGTTLEDSTDAAALGYRNARIISVAGRLASQMPAWSDRNVRFSETVQVAGEWVWVDSTHVYGLGSSLPAIQFLGDELEWLWLKDNVDATGTIWDGDKLQGEYVVGFRREDLTRLDAYDMYIDGNQRNSRGLWDNSSDYATGTNLSSYLQDAPRGLPWYFGVQDSTPGPTPDADGIAGYVYFHGVNRTTDVIQGSLSAKFPDTQPIYKFMSTAAADTFWVGNPGYDDNHHCTYQLFGEFNAIKATGWNCDVMHRNAGIDIGTHIYTDPEDQPYTSGNGIDPTFSPLPQRLDPETSFAGRIDTNTVRRIEYDLPQYADNIFNGLGDSEINYAENGGWIYSSGRSDIALTTGSGPVSGFVGPDLSTGADSLLVKSLDTNPMRMSLAASSFVRTRDVLTFRGIRHVDMTSAGTGTDPMLGIDDFDNVVQTIRIEHSDLHGGEGKFVNAQTADTTMAGVDVFVDSSSVYYGAYLISFVAAGGTSLDTPNDSLLALRTRVLVTGDSEIQEIRPSPGSVSGWAALAADRSMRLFDDVVDDQGRTASVTATHNTGAGDEGNTEVCDATTLMWAPREITVNSIVASSGTFSVNSTAVNETDGTNPYVRPIEQFDDYRDPQVCFTLDSAIGVGVTVSINYTARVTPAAEQRLSRPFVLTDSVPTPSVAVGATTDVDLSTMCENRDYAGNAGAGSLTYRFLESSDESVATGSISGSTITITGVASGTATLYGLCEDAAGTESAVKLDVTVP